MMNDIASVIPSLSELLYNVASGIAQYILLSLSLYLISRALSLPCPAFSWIPFLQHYRLGQIADLYTDNRMTTAEDRASPYYKPSRLRVKILVADVVTAVAAIVTTVAAALSLEASLASFSFLFAKEEVRIPETVTNAFVTTALIAFAAGILCLVFVIIHLVAYCRALCRVFTALDTPVPGLFTALAVLIPLAGLIALYVYTRKAQDLAARFSPVPEPDYIDINVDSNTTESDTAQ